MPMSSDMGNVYSFYCSDVLGIYCFEIAACLFNVESWAFGSFYVVDTRCMAGMK